MTMTKDVAQLRITASLREAEAALDTALITQAALLGTLVTSRRETDSDPFAGHAELLRLVKSQQALLTAGGDLARVHGGLLGVAREMAVFEECPENEPIARTGKISLAA